MLKKVLFSIFIFIIILEVVLRVNGKFKTSNEKSSGNYFYRYHQTKDSWFHHWKRNMPSKYLDQEFTYINNYNEFGIREQKLDSFLTDSTVANYLCLGDSFTEGDGAPYDSSWVRIVEYLFNKERAEKAKFYNAGVCGSDVFFNHQWLKSDLMKMKPKHIIECINTSDISDVLWFGGNERFNKDGTCTGKTGPNWEHFYKYSHIFRSFVHSVLKYNDNLIKTKSEDYAIDLIKEELIKTNKWCIENGIQYTVILQMCPHELKLKNYYPTFFSQLKDLEFVVDISNDLNNAINSENYLSYSWTYNGHFNSTGYAKLAEVIYKNLPK